MYFSSNPTAMTKVNGAAAPDLSLQISPPSAQPHLNEAPYRNIPAKAPTSAGDRSSTADSASSGSDLSHENGFEPSLRLGFEPERQTPLRRRQHYRHPQLYGVREVKRRSSAVNGVRRSVRAPRMRWTSTLHAHFVHAVDLLGGHERTIFRFRFRFRFSFSVFLLLTFLKKLEKRE